MKRKIFIFALGLTPVVVFPAGAADVMVTGINSLAKTFIK